MPNPLETAFRSYVRQVKSQLRLPRKKSKGKLSVISNSEFRVRELVAELEAKDAFHDLVAATREAFPECDSKSTHISFWSHAVRNFLRRSGFYLVAARSRSPHVGKYLSQYRAAFSKTEEQITYLAPMELVRFAKPHFRFEGFSVRRFSRTELARLLEAEVNRIFVPVGRDERRPTGSVLVYLPVR